MGKKLFGKQTEAALDNFPFSTHHTQMMWVYAICEIKKAAALANFQSGNLPHKVSLKIIKACDQILEGKFDDQFVTSSLQGGAGTSVNMNVNEVIASIVGVHPLDDVNKSQSTNDVNPSALRIVCIRLVRNVLRSSDRFILALKKKAEEFSHILKLARTHLQDAVPITLGEEFLSYASLIEDDKKRLESAIDFLSFLNLGGTAVGNGINASKEYTKAVYKELNQIIKLNVKPAANFMSKTSSQTDFCFLSQALVTLCLDASKIASDLRILSSGPGGGIGEITLAKMQDGSSIMPGKVNPVIAESVNQLYFLVSGNNVTIESAAHGAQLELGVMLPIIADNLITSLKLTQEVLSNFAVQCVSKITANKKRCLEILESSTAYATILTPILGYDIVAEAVSKSVTNNLSIREVIIEEGLMSEEDFNKVVGLT